MRNSRFLDRCFGTLILLALLALFTAVAFALADHEPRAMRTTLLLQGPR